MGRVPRRVHGLQRRRRGQRGPGPDARIESFERLAGRKLSWVYFSQNWYRWLQFPRERVDTIWRHGAVPYIAFLPTSGDFYGAGRLQHNPEKRYTLQRIVDGVFDRQLRAWADGARRANVPILLSFGAEVNDDWGPWNAKWNGAGETTGYGDPTYPDGARALPRRVPPPRRRLPRGGRHERHLRLPRRFLPAARRLERAPLVLPGRRLRRLDRDLGVRAPVPEDEAGAVRAEALRLGRLRDDGEAEPAAVRDRRDGRRRRRAAGSATRSRRSAPGGTRGSAPSPGGTWTPPGSTRESTRRPASLEAFRGGVAGTFFSAGLRFSSSCR